MKYVGASLIILSVVLSTVSFAIQAPQNLNAKAFPGKSVLLTWDKVDDATTYNVYRKNAAETDAQKIAETKDLMYEDSSIASSKKNAGNDYVYSVTAMSNGIESGPSRQIGAPVLSIDVQALVNTSRVKPASMRSIKTGGIVTFASPGDRIIYRLSCANKGVSSARNAVINYAIPKGTVYSGWVLRKGSAPKVSFYDKSVNSWISKVKNPENITKVQFSINEKLKPVNTGANEVIDLNVVITL